MYLVYVLSIAGSILGSADKADHAKKDLEALQGSWTVEVLQYNGKDYTAKYPFSLVFKGKVVTVEGNDEVKKDYAKLSFTLDPTTTPKLIDLSVGGGAQKDAAIEGVYELKGDRLRMCVKVVGKDRPSEFKSADGTSVALLTLKRSK